MIEQPAVAIGVFDTQEQARAAIEALRAAGYLENQIGYLARARVEADTSPEAGENANAALTTGAATGGLIGGIVGAAAALVIPGIGPALAGGILAATLGGAAIGATAGSLVTLLTGLGVPENEAHRYQREMEAGRTIVTVKTASDYDRAIQILRANGARDTTVEHDVYTQPNLARGSWERTDDSPPAGGPGGPGVVS